MTYLDFMRPSDRKLALKSYVNYLKGYYSSYGLLTDTFENYGGNVLTIYFDYSITGDTKEAREYYMAMEQAQKKIKDFCKARGFKYRMTVYNYDAYLDIWEG